MDLDLFQRRLDREIAQAIQGREPVSFAARRIATAPSKKVRSRFLFALGAACDLDSELRLRGSVAIEILHTASLIHDDIIDGASERRGVSTIHAQEGSPLAILSGDFLLARAMRLLAAHPLSLEVAGEVVEAMSVSAYQEVALRYDAGLTVRQWEEIALGKTARLFGLCGFFAGIEGRSREVDGAIALRSAGEHLGMAFQLRDDLEDFSNYFRNEREGARPFHAESPLQDLLSGNPSMPLALAFDFDPSLRTIVEEFWRFSQHDEESVARVAERVWIPAVRDEICSQIQERVRRFEDCLAENAQHSEVQFLVRYAHSLADIPGAFA